MLDARVWLCWALSVLVAASSTRNPLYVVLVLLTVAAVELAWGPAASRRPAVFRFGAVAVPLAAAFNGLTVHFGETVLFALPAWLPLLGGAVTLEALVYGAANGLVLTAIFGGFMAMYRVTPARDLVRLTPRAFYEAGVVLSIALTFIPHMRRSVERIREAQAVRGHRVRGLRDWLPIFVPLLIGGLERAFGLAEAMVARGYGATADRAHPLRAQLALLVGLSVLLGGWLGYLFQPAWRPVAAGAIALGAGIILALVWLAGRAVRHTTYRTRSWTARDTLAVVGCALALAPFVLPLPGIGRETLAYSPYPGLAPPPFDPVIGAAVLGLLVPALLAGREGAAGD